MGRSALTTNTFLFYDMDCPAKEIKEKKSSQVKALGKKRGGSGAEGTVCPKRPEVEKEEEKCKKKSIGKQLKKARQDPKYALDRMLASLGNTDPEDLFPGLSDGSDDSEAGPPVTRETRGSSRPARSSSSESVRSTKSKKAPKKPRKEKKAKRPLVSAEGSTAAGGTKDAGSASTGALDGEVPVGSQSLPLAKAGFTELITELNNLIAQDNRLALQKKERLVTAFGKLVNLYDEVKIENVALRAENKVLRSTGPAPRKTFAQAAAQPPTVQARAVKPSPEPTKKVHTVFISKEGKSSKEVQRLVTTLVSPARDGIKVKRMRSTPKTLILETNDESDVAKLTTHPGLRNEQLLVEAPRKRNPLMIVYDVPRDIKDNELVNAIHDQNFGETDQEAFESQFRLRFKVGPRSRDTVHHVVEVTGPLRRHILGVGRLYVGFTSHAVKDYTVLPRCLRCQDLGHVTKHCRQTESVCAHCGEQGHTRGQCGKRGLPAVCIPCHARKKRCGEANSTGCQTYKLLWDRLVSRIDYG